jgi:hypothetical protein
MCKKEEMSFTICDRNSILFTFYKTLTSTQNSTSTPRQNGVSRRIFVQIIQDLGVWLYCLIIILNLKSKEYIGIVEEIS